MLLWTLTDCKTRHSKGSFSKPTDRMSLKFRMWEAHSVWIILGRLWGSECTQTRADTSANGSQWLEEAEQHLDGPEELHVHLEFLWEWKESCLIKHFSPCQFPQRLVQEKLRSSVSGWVSSPAVRVTKGVFTPDCSFMVQLFEKGQKKPTLIWPHQVLVATYRIFKLQHVGSSSLTKDQTWVPCIGRAES